MDSKTFHICTNIEGLLRNTKGRKITFFDDDDGNPLTDKEARELIWKAKAKGHKLIGSADCKGFDPFGGGCPGHTIVPAPVLKDEVKHLETEISQTKLNL